MIVPTPYCVVWICGSYYWTYCPICNEQARRTIRSTYNCWMWACARPVGRRSALLKHEQSRLRDQSPLLISYRRKHQTIAQRSGVLQRICATSTSKLFCVIYISSWWLLDLSEAALGRLFAPNDRPPIPVVRSNFRALRTTLRDLHI